jgi:hypothetical protein
VSLASAWTLSKNHLSDQPHLLILDEATDFAMASSHCLPSRFRFALRRMTAAIWSRILSRKFTFAVSAISLIGAKLVRIYAHLNALTTGEVVLWGLSFFFQDAFVLLILFQLVDVHTFGSSRNLSFWTAAVASGTAAILLLLAAISISFFAVSGSELRWHNVSVAVDSSWWAMLPSVLSSFAAVFAGLLLGAAALQDFCHMMASTSVDVLRWPAKCVLRSSPVRRVFLLLGREYIKLEQWGIGRPPGRECTVDASPLISEFPAIEALVSNTVRYVVASLGFAALLLSTMFRPANSSLAAMSWTLPLLPVIDFAQSSPASASHPSSKGGQTSQSWANKTALAQPMPLPWLPKSPKLLGFEDWYEIGKEHYLAAADPLKISNIDDQPLATLRNTLKDAAIQHVVLIILESQRKDSFPFKKDGIIWERLANSFDNESLPVEAQRKLAALTPNANFLTGDYNDGFKHEEHTQRGGINANNAHTSSTYTLKSLTGTLCGVFPLVVDFNAEHEHHVYQPCLPHVFKALNNIPSHNHTKRLANFTSFQWRTLHMQSATMGMDKQDSLMSALGYSQGDIISKEYLQSDSAKFGKVSLPKVNYFSLPEVALEDYIREAFASAERNKERLFLSHLTSTTHHDFGMPETEQYVPLAGDTELDTLSRYMNTIGYSDRWLGKILQILEDSAVANQTLVVLVGDHGIPIPEGSVSTYGNSNTAGIHVPLVFSHPQLPHVNIDDAVTSLQILPTILDLLIESGSGLMNE